jgi:uncharacterized membrane protein
VNANTSVLGTQDEGKVGAAIVYVLYLLSIPSAGTLFLLGFIIAYVMRGGSSGWVRTHFDRQIKIGWKSFWWTLGLGLLFAIGIPLSIVLIGIPMMWVAGVGLLIVHIWMAVASVLGLISLLQTRPA